MMDVQNLTVRLKKGPMLLDHLSFSLQPGVCAGLTGPSGSGKTTLLKALLGVLDGNVTVEEGEIWLDEKDLLKKTEKARRNLCGTVLGFIPQNPMTAFHFHVPIGAQMAETFRKRLRLDKTEAKELCMETLKKVNLADTGRICAAYPNQLSGGMLQRITMAILLGLNPKYIFADEPTSALDEENKQYLIEELEQIKEGAAILFVSHDDAAMQRLCDELLILQCGAIVERGPTEQLFAHPEQEWTKEFAALSRTQEGGGFTWSKL